MRILISGSRDWVDADVIYGAIRDACRDYRHAVLAGPCVLVHGGARGADTIADRWARKWGWQVEVHPAVWSTHGRAAGPIRNAAMVAAGADVCLAFIRNGSRGATGCADLAERAGITTRRYLA